ncbi:BREX-2 system adenine-specific DNA-methyltransferase PglX [Asanoa iriomotensis]|uniref:site-specific DNA-methyltransferase (adenine-specific) n=1 Tax=Asanoa iriomotensis TaxID=234613 RepID=A0ABQ4C1J5_9ACTN|nr:BREX-2 system adenine-specific DNA-methyltransferase PglX [Asanoa iriomotensis]GIF56653.1 DNA methylase [Asanoa iriomotensis]
MIALKPLQHQVTLLVDDLRAQVAADDTLRSELHREYEGARTARRLGRTFESYLEDVLDQAAVAWVLCCVFVRFCEDNRLVVPVWLGGPDDRAPIGRGVQERQRYLIDNPTHNDRHFLRSAFSHLRDKAATGNVFDSHNPVWRFDISGRAAEDLSDFFRRGEGLASFVDDDDLDTRFLGDLYQDLSVHARVTYALLQTPEFVEEFVLDRAFEPAYAEFGLARMSVIDPTCGSGHFLLGAFDRLVTRWKQREPATDVRLLVQRALDQVTGVDVNPFAVAIARFRLVVAALKECGLRNLETAPDFNLRLAVGDSLLDWGRKSRHQGDLIDLVEGRSAFAFATEDADALGKYLEQGLYTVVVGNPPYITVKDPARNAAYREAYPEVCHRQYQLTVPFAKRFFDLAKRGDGDGVGAGWVGQITANAFMKREFGTKLINAYFAHQIELTEVIDTSGAYIPGHGTPTVILVGRANHLKRSGTVRAVLGMRGEPGQPAVASEGLVWKGIVRQIDSPGSESDWVSVLDIGRRLLLTHPWSLSGGGASDVMGRINSASSTSLSDIDAVVGFYAITGADDAYFLPTVETARRLGDLPVRWMIEGDEVRDYGLNPGNLAVWPYDDSLRVVDYLAPKLEQFLWPSKPILLDRKRFGTPVTEIKNFAWFEYREFYRSRVEVPLTIVFAFVTTHNHFVLDRGDKLFKQSSPVIKLPEGAGEDAHLRLLGLLNSSTACFWLKQVSHDKGGQGVNEGFKSQDWERFYEFTGTKLKEFPLPAAYPLELARRLDASATRLAEVSPSAVASDGVPTLERLAAAKVEWLATRRRMIALQEEIDWRVYRLYDLMPDDLTALDADVPELAPGERAFEIVLARKIAAGETDTVWFARHGSRPITELPAHWSAGYRAKVEKRVAAIESDRNIELIERPECKRRWSTDGWEALEQAALRGWLLDRLEATELWGGAPTPMSVAQLADRVRHYDDFRHVLDLWVGTDQHDLVRSVAKLVADEHVPFLPRQRYKAAGLRKRAQWERTWALQRRVDAGESFDIAVPPKYSSTDFVKQSYWRHRGKLDVPKERFVSYPKAGRDGDATELIGWAGWDHLAQAQALATVYLDRKTQGGWPPDRLLPLLAGLAELEPWLHQWHRDPRPGFPGTPATFFSGLIDTELSALDADRAALADLRGVEVPA